MMPGPATQVHRGSSNCHQRDLCMQLWQLRTNFTLCDVALKVGGALLPAHRIVLCACSPVLLIRFTLLNQPMGYILDLTADCISYDICQSVLEYMYTGVVPKLPKKRLQELNWLVEHWQLTSLQAKLATKYKYMQGAGTSKAVVASTTNKSGANRGKAPAESAVNSNNLDHPYFKDVYKGINTDPGESLLKSNISNSAEPLPISSSDELVEEEFCDCECAHDDEPDECQVNSDTSAVPGASGNTVVIKEETDCEEQVYGDTSPSPAIQFEVSSSEPQDPADSENVIYKDPTNSNTVQENLEAPIIENCAAQGFNGNEEQSIETDDDHPNVKEETNCEEQPFGEKSPSPAIQVCSSEVQDPTDSENLIYKILTNSYTVQGNLEGPSIENGATEGADGNEELSIQTHDDHPCIKEETDCEEQLSGDKSPSPAEVCSSEVQDPTDSENVTFQSLKNSCTVQENLQASCKQNGAAEGVDGNEEQSVETDDHPHVKEETDCGELFGDKGLSPAGQFEVSISEPQDPADPENEIYKGPTNSNTVQENLKARIIESGTEQGVNGNEEQGIQTHDDHPSVKEETDCEELFGDKGPLPAQDPTDLENEIYKSLTNSYTVQENQEASCIENGVTQDEERSVETGDHSYVKEADYEELLYRGPSQAIQFEVCKSEAQDPTDLENVIYKSLKNAKTGKKNLETSCIENGAKQVINGNEEQSVATDDHPGTGRDPLIGNLWPRNLHLSCDSQIQLRPTHYQDPLDEENGNKMEFRTNSNITEDVAYIMLNMAEGSSEDISGDETQKAKPDGHSKGRFSKSNERPQVHHFQLHGETSHQISQNSNTVENSLIKYETTQEDPNTIPCTDIVNRPSPVIQNIEPVDHQTESGFSKEDAELISFIENCSPHNPLKEAHERDFFSFTGDIQEERSGHFDENLQRQHFQLDGLPELDDIPFSESLFLNNQSRFDERQHACDTGPSEQPKLKPDAAIQHTIGEERKLPNMNGHKNTPTVGNRQETSMAKTKRGNSTSGLLNKKIMRPCLPDETELPGIGIFLDTQVGGDKPLDVQLSRSLPFITPELLTLGKQNSELVKISQFGMAENQIPKMFQCSQPKGTELLSRNKQLPVDNSTLILLKIVQHSQNEKLIPQNNENVHYVLAKDTGLRQSRAIQHLEAQTAKYLSKAQLGQETVSVEQHGKPTHLSKTSSTQQEDAFRYIPAQRASATELPHNATVQRFQPEKTMYEESKDWPEECFEKHLDHSEVLKPPSARFGEHLVVSDANAQRSEMIHSKAAREIKKRPHIVRLVPQTNPQRSHKLQHSSTERKAQHMRKVILPSLSEDQEKNQEDSLAEGNHGTESQTGNVECQVNTGSKTLKSDQINSGRNGKAVEFSQGTDLQLQTQAGQCQIGLPSQQTEEMTLKFAIQKKVAGHQNTRKKLQSGNSGLKEAVSTSQVENAKDAMPAKQTVSIEHLEVENTKLNGKDMVQDLPPTKYVTKEQQGRSVKQLLMKKTKLQSLNLQPAKRLKLQNDEVQIHSDQKINDGKMVVSNEKVAEVPHQKLRIKDPKLWEALYLSLSSNAVQDLPTNHRTTKLGLHPQHVTKKQQSRVVERLLLKKMKLQTLHHQAVEKLKLQMDKVQAVKKIKVEADEQDDAEDAVCDMKQYNKSDTPGPPTVRTKVHSMSDNPGPPTGEMEEFNMIQSPEPPTVKKKVYSMSNNPRQPAVTTKGYNKSHNPEPPTLMTEEYMRNIPGPPTLKTEDFNMIDSPEPTSVKTKVYSISTNPGPPTVKTMGHNMRNNFGSPTLMTEDFMSNVPGPPTRKMEEFNMIESPEPTSVKTKVYSISNNPRPPAVKTKCYNTSNNPEPPNSMTEEYRRYNPGPPAVKTKGYNTSNNPEPPNSMTEEYRRYNPGPPAVKTKGYNTSNNPEPPTLMTEDYTRYNPGPPTAKMEEFNIINNRERPTVTTKGYNMSMDPKPPTVMTEVCMSNNPGPPAVKTEGYNMRNNPGPPTLMTEDYTRYNPGPPIAKMEEFNMIQSPEPPTVKKKVYSMSNNPRQPAVTTKGYNKSHNPEPPTLMTEEYMRNIPGPPTLKTEDFNMIDSPEPTSVKTKVYSISTNPGPPTVKTMGHNIRNNSGPPTLMTEDFMSNVPGPPTRKMEEFNMIKSPEPTSVKTKVYSISNNPGQPTVKTKVYSMSNNPGQPTVTTKGYNKSHNPEPPAVKTEDFMINNPEPPAVKTIHEEQYLCSNCLMLFDERALLKVHRHSFHETEQYTCGICNLSYDSRSHLQTHVTEYHWREGIEIDLTVDTKNLLQARNAECDQQTDVKCELSSSPRYTLNKQVHEYSRQNGRKDAVSFYCEHPQCTYKTHDMKILSEHRELHAVVPAKKRTLHMCQECGESYLNARRLAKHKEQNHKRVKLSCTLCAFSCIRKWNLAEHLWKKHDLVKEGKTSYQCSVCGFKTLQLAIYKLHKTTHKPCRDKQFVCKVCGRRYHKADGLQKHMTYHSGDAKLYRCPHCDYVAVNNKTTLQTHVQLMHDHKGEKRFPCDACDYACNYKGNLYKHLRQVHKRDPCLPGQGHNKTKETKPGVKQENVKSKSRKGKKGKSKAAVKLK